MKHTLIKAALSATALFAAGQANAADFILSSSPSNTADAYHFFTTTVSAGKVTANLNNAPGPVAPFTDNFYFALTFLASLGSGSVTSDSTLNLDFATVPVGIIITEYAASPSFLADLLTAYTTTNQTVYNNELAALTSYAGPGVKVGEGTYTPNGTGGATVALNNVPLNNTSFYKVSITGSSTVDGAYGGTVSATAVPEPATWAMLLAGFGAVGFAMRRRRTQNVKVSFA
jgi:hypothetical protein